MIGVDNFYHFDGYAEFVQNQCHDTDDDNDDDKDDDFT